MQDLQFALSELHALTKYKLRVIVASRTELPPVAHLPRAAIQRLDSLPRQEAERLLYHHWHLQAAGEEPAGSSTPDWGSYEDGRSAKELVQRVHCNPLLLLVAGRMVGLGRMTWQVTFVS